MIESSKYCPGASRWRRSKAWKKAKRFFWTAAAASRRERQSRRTVGMRVAIIGWIMRKKIDITLRVQKPKLLPNPSTSAPATVRTTARMISLPLRTRRHTKKRTAATHSKCNTANIWTRTIKALKKVRQTSQTALVIPKWKRVSRDFWESWFSFTGATFSYRIWISKLTSNSKRATSSTTSSRPRCSRCRSACHRKLAICPIR